MANVGTITAIWRYPVKLMIGNALDAPAITEQRLLGDRARRRLTTATLDRLGELYPSLMVTLPPRDVSKDQASCARARSTMASEIPGSGLRP
jgi:hypothetical protein